MNKLPRYKPYRDIIFEEHEDYELLVTGGDVLSKVNEIIDWINEQEDNKDQARKIAIDMDARHKILKNNL